MDDKKRKDKIRAIMEGLMHEAGWPDCERHVIMERLPLLWRHLEVSGLLKPEWTYDQFKASATEAFLYTNMTDAIKNDFFSEFRS